MTVLVLAVKIERRDSLALYGIVFFIVKKIKYKKKKKGVGNDHPAPARIVSVL
jgi:hypothetical protein